MSYKDILVHINISKHCPQRLDIAARLAKAFGARLTGVYTSAAADVPFFMMEEIEADAEPVMRAWWMQMRGKAKAQFDAAQRSTGVAADWAEVESDVGAAVPYLARYSDLAIVGQTDPDELLPRPEYEVPERVVLESGRPALVVPHGAEFATVGRRVLIAWNGSPQSARAVNDALPLLQQAEKVTVLSVNPDDFSQNKNDSPSARIAAHLARHGIDSEVQQLVVDDGAADATILSRAVDLKADLIVMGAYGHARAREMILGGATRHLFRHMTVPVLMSH